MIACGPGGSTTEEVFAAVNEAQLRGWDSVAAAMTSDSYANQPEDEFVIIYSSNDDGTYSETTTTVYSALHYSHAMPGQADDEIERIENAGVIAEASVVAEGDIQVARVAQEVVVQTKTAEAHAMTSDSYAVQPLGETVRIYYYDAPSDTILYNDTSDFSSLHWAEEAKFAASGLIYEGVWAFDASCTLPPDATLDGMFYIVDTVDPACTSYSTGDWIVWSSAQWNRINWNFSWSAIVGVTVDGRTPINGDNLADTSYVDAANATQDAAIALNTAKVSYKDTMTFDGTTLTITIG